MLHKNLSITDDFRSKLRVKPEAAKDVAAEPVQEEAQAG
jgi:hypothetical protein